MTAVHELRGFVGEALAACASAWHDFEGSRSTDPLDTWLTFGAVTINLRGASNGQGMVAHPDEVGTSFDMQEYGSVAVAENTPALLAACVGGVLRGVRELGYESWPGESVGLVLDFAASSIAFFNLSDETEVAVWSAQLAEQFSLTVIGP